MKGKAIYNPSGKAGEYSYWAVNFYNGCSADCSYCYCKRGVLSRVWSTTPTLKKGLTDPDFPLRTDKAIEIFENELLKNLSELQKHGLFFNSTSDPFLRETIDLNLQAMDYCNLMDIPVKALTKQTWWVNEHTLPKNVAIGYTLTGMDEMEQGAASNAERIEALNKFHYFGYRTWASIEPVVDINNAYSIIVESLPYVNHYKIGPLSGKRFELSEVNDFIVFTNKLFEGSDATVYWKDEFIEKIGIIRDSLPGNCVNRDYRFWGEK